LVMCLAVPAVSALFGNAYESAPLFLALLAIQYLFTAFGALSVGGLLTGQGKTGFVLKTAFLTGCIGFTFGYFAIIAFGVLGLILTTMVAGLPSLILGLRFIQKTYNVSIDWISSVKILFASGSSALTTFLLVNALIFSSWVELILGTTFFICMFILLILLFKAIDRNDIITLRQMIMSLGTIGLVFSKVISILEKMMSLLSW
jgi:O-antigen/teichoic acid export membrane protein